MLALHYFPPNRIISTFEVFWGWMCNYVMWPNMSFLSFPHLHGSEMVDHILKPEIFTTNAMGTSFQTHQDGPFPTTQKRNHHHQQRYQWYVLIPMGIWFGIIPTFQVFWGWMCNYVMWHNMFFLSFPHLHGSEMVYHILKPEIFTTNAMGTSFQTHQDGPFPTTQKRNHHHQQRYQWYVLIPMGIWFGIIETFQVFWGWMCNYVMWHNMSFLSFPHLHGSEMVYHILKPEIFTTNAMGTSFQTHQDGPFPTIQKRNHHLQQRYQWYVLIPMGIWFGIIPTFQVFWGWMCNYVMWPNMFFLFFPHLHGSEMVYHILKPEIFTTNAMGTSFQTHQDGPFPTIQKRNHHHQHIRKNVRRYAR